MIVTYDWEFLERGPELPIIPISLGMVRSDGAELYLISEEAPLSAIARHPWLQMNVVPHLPMKMELDHTPNYTGGIIEWDPEHPDYSSRASLDAMRAQVREFLDVDPERLELWGYYAAYDHVLLAQLFGTMVDLPYGIPMYTHDIMQEARRQGGVPLPPMSTVGVHHALHDARWTMEAYKWLHERPEMREKAEEKT